MRLTDIGENEKVIVALWIAEDSLEMIENKDEDYCFCKETIHLCWDWVINKNVSHLMLYERLSVGSGRSIADILLDKEEDDPEQYYGTISECVAYITWQAFNYAEVYGYPEDLEECETGTGHFEELINELLEENVIEQGKFENLLCYLKENDFERNKSAIREKVTQMIQDKSI